MTPFSYGRTVHSTPGFTQVGATPEQLRTVKRVLNASYMTDKSYQLRVAAAAFLQGYDEKSGWVLVEFWNRNEAAHQALIDHINAEVQVLMEQSARETES